MQERRQVLHDGHVGDFKKVLYLMLLSDGVVCVSCHLLIKTKRTGELILHIL